MKELPPKGDISSSNKIHPPRQAKPDTPQEGNFRASPYLSQLFNLI